MNSKKLTDIRKKYKDIIDKIFEALPECSLNVGEAEIRAVWLRDGDKEYVLKNSARMNSECTDALNEDTVPEAKYINISFTLDELKRTIVAWPDKIAILCKRAYLQDARLDREMPCVFAKWLPRTTGFACDWVKGSTSIIDCR